jgi:hypothetical protein
MNNPITNEHRIADLTKRVYELEDVLCGVLSALSEDIPAGSHLFKFQELHERFTPRVNRLPIPAAQ